MLLQTCRLNNYLTHGYDMDCLLLNSDGQPLSLLPLSAIKWKQAITYMWLDKVTVLEWYDDWIVRSERWETRVPAVIMLKQMMKRKSKPRFTKHNLYLRDLNTCQYCGEQFDRSQLTLDHVIPLSLGGDTAWENIVAACAPCNGRKGNSLGPTPIREPYRPDYWDLAAKRKQLDIQLRHPSWQEFLY